MCLVAAVCAALPDIDVIGFAPHRAITHSILFAALAALTVTLLFFPGIQAQTRRQIGIVLFVAALSHGCLDALSKYSWGIEFFAPFSNQRFRFPWTPLGRPDGDLVGQLVQEVVVLILPALILAWLGLRRRRRVEPA